MTDMPLARRLRSLPLHSRRRSTREADRPTSRPIYASADDEHPVHLTLPGPRTLAETAVLPALAERGVTIRRGPDPWLYVLRDGAEPERITTATLAERDILPALRAMPEPRAEDGETRAALHTLAHRARPEHANSYALLVARQARTLSAKYEAPKGPRAKGMTGAEREAKRAASERERAVATAAAWFPGWLRRDGVPDDITPPDLYATFKGDAEGWLAYCAESTHNEDEWLLGVHEERGGPECLPALPGSRTFYGVATEVLGDKRRAPGGRAWLYSTVAKRREMGLLPGDGETLADLFAEEYVPDAEARRRSA